MNNNWYQSAELAQAENGVLYFEVSEEQKKYMEKHMNEVDQKLEHKLGVVPHTIRFEKDWNGTEECYTCEAYINKF